MSENINLKQIAKGTLIAIVLSAVFLFIFAIILVNTNIQESSIRPTVIVITGISILIGSSISSRKINKNGIINGGIIGIIYISIIYILSSIALSGFGINIYSIITIILGAIAGMLGGVIGINLK